MTNAKARGKSVSDSFRHSLIRASFVVRHSTFVILEVHQITTLDITSLASYNTTRHGTF